MAARWLRPVTPSVGYWLRSWTGNRRLVGSNPNPLENMWTGEVAVQPSLTPSSTDEVPLSKAPEPPPVPGVLHCGCPLLPLCCVPQCVWTSNKVSPVCACVCTSVYGFTGSDGLKAEKEFPSKRDNKG